MSNVRQRRLAADIAKVQDYVRQHPRVRLIQTTGDPPERYQLEYRIDSLRMVGTELQTVQSHVVEIVLPLNYPRIPPVCRMLSPVFHPNIAPHAICVGDHWGAGESLASIIMRIGEMLAYQSYNLKSPLNGEAARWVEQNKDRLPLDRVSLLPEENREVRETPATPRREEPIAATSAPVPRRETFSAESNEKQPTTGLSSKQSGDSTQMTVRCRECQAMYHVARASSGRVARCTKCGKLFKCESIVV